MTRTLVPADHTTQGLDASFAELARAGGWFSGRERLAIAREARAARTCGLCADRKAALSPYSVTGTHTTVSSDVLASAACDAIHRITTDPGRLSQQWYDEIRDASLEPEEIVELTSVLSVIAIADSLSRALSLPERSLPEPEAGQPRRQSIVGARVDRGWVPMVDPDAAEGLTKTMYESVQSAAGFVFNVARALTSVPEALRDFFGAFFPNYSTHGPVRPGGLSRIQVELLASSTSAYNDCFY
jgi:hypothetical protein